MAHSRSNAEAFAALNQAALAITSELSLEKTLQQVVDSARQLVEARYAALGIPDSEGLLSQFLVSGMSADEAQQVGHRPTGRGLLGLLLRDTRPIRISRIADDPRSVGFPPGHPPMSSFLGVPIRARGKTLGNLYLADKLEAVEFSETDEELIELLAAHAAIAIQNAKLYEQVGRLAILEERSRIGMDLHDGVIQSIYAVGLTLESARLALRDDPPAADEILAQSINGLNDAIRDIRNFILDLRPQRFEGDLGKGIARLVREFQANALVPVDVRVTPEAVARLPVRVAQTLFLSTQEALANIARHARATQVMLEVRRENGLVRLTVADNGRGFDLARQNMSVGHGLANMRTRAEELQGLFSLQSRPGQGTHLTLTIPV